MKYVCTVCGYVYEGESLPADFVCPVCKAPASKFAAQTGEREWAAEHVVGVAKGVSEDIVAIMNRGRIIAVDTPQKLKEKVGRVVVEHMEADGMINNFFDNREQAASYVAGLNSNATVREANLEDVFIELTGRRVND